jgi:transcriptional regulator with XRE-family HTH domain
VAARERLRTAGLSRREICRRLGTSASQLYRLIDARNGRTSMRQLVTLLHVLGCDVSLKVSERGARR